MTMTGGSSGGTGGSSFGGVRYFCQYCNIWTDHISAEACPRVLEIEYDDRRNIRRIVFRPAPQVPTKVTLGTASMPARYDYSIPGLPPTAWTGGCGGWSKW